MALVAFLRGVNVGGYRAFRPSVLARQLARYDVVNIGAAGTFVVRSPGPRRVFRAELARRLPFSTEVALCDARDLLALEADPPFAATPSPPGVVRFVSVLAKTARLRPAMPILLPPDGPWLLRMLGTRGPFIFGEYRRQMKAIGYLGQIDKFFGAPATTRNWNTIAAILRVLKTPPPAPPRGR